MFNNKLVNISFLTSLAVHFLVIYGVSFSLSLEKELNLEEIKKEMTKEEKLKVKKINSNQNTLSISNGAYPEAGFDLWGNMRPKMYSKDSFKKLMKHFDGQKDKIMKQAESRVNQKKLAIESKRSVKRFISMGEDSELSEEKEKTVLVKDTENDPLSIILIDKKDVSKDNKKKKKLKQKCTKSKYVGIGIALSQSASTPEMGIIQKVAKGYPAEALGLKKGDVFLGMKKNGKYYPMTSLVRGNKVKEGEEAIVLMKKDGKIIEKKTRLKRICYEDQRDLEKK